MVLIDIAICHMRATLKYDLTEAQRSHRVYHPNYSPCRRAALFAAIIFLGSAQVKRADRRNNDLKEEAVVPDLELLGVSSGSYALRRQFVHTDAKVVHDDLRISTRQRFKDGIVNEHVLFLKRAKCVAAQLLLGLGFIVRLFSLLFCQPLLRDHTRAATWPNIRIERQLCVGSGRIDGTDGTCMYW